ncbi:prenyltransferase/squalene oxidase repeat-containing protein [Bryobacter aggregatus]|uniref:prenyltransferase/squalene oxidase repeat-containing protein n=1 Tax=Bryobacter aggregatus TaxID=360054 RepID=UPI0012BAF69D|nr:prenyltransferase/squalene oxidase repeat-containing protein [Bryobacter aggregatus]
MSRIEARRSLLRTSQNRDGGWGYFAGQESRVEATAYALRAMGSADATWEPGIAFLLARQEKDGGLAPSPSVPGSSWVTNLAFPLLKRAQTGTKPLERMADWILKTEGAEGGFRQRLLYAMGMAQADQNPRLKGWPWRPGNNSWVEPTAHGLLALRWMEGLAPEVALRYRRELGTQMLLDRRCSDGGWNYGNKKVLGETLPAYPETTGLALLGLAGSRIDAAILEPSLARAKADFATVQGAYGRALLALALRLHGIECGYRAATEEPHPSRNLMLASIEILAESDPAGVFLP